MELEILRLTLKGQTLAEMQDFLMSHKMTELEAIALEAGIESPASTKRGVTDAIIAKLTSGEDVIEPDDAVAANDEASSGQGVLPGEVLGGGVSIPGKVAAMPSEKLWPEILGWEIKQGLDENAPVCSTDELREYLGYLWHMGSIGRAPSTWLRITEYEFKGIAS